METLESKVETARIKAESSMNNLKKINPCEGCEMKGKSTCCGADIVMHDICVDCGEHADNSCDHCDWRER